MPELDAERRERLAEALEEVVADLNNRGAISDGYGWTEIAEGLAPLIAGWLAEADRRGKAAGYDEGCAKASPFGGGYLRSFYAENPYRAGEGA